MTKDMISVEERDELQIITIIGSTILDENSVVDFGQQAKEAIESVQDRTSRVVIDLKNVDHISSAGLGTLITINNQIKRMQRGDLILASPIDKIREDLAITRLDKLFYIADDLDHAKQIADGKGIL